VPPRHPPFDPELLIALRGMEGRMATASLTPDDIPAIRSEILEATPTLDELRQDRSIDF
jgi:hypothetical protein